jgi:hypothetical protein
MLGHLNNAFIAIATVIGGSGALGAAFIVPTTGRIIEGTAFLLLGLVLLGRKFYQTYEDGFRDGQKAAVETMADLTRSQPARPLGG